MEKLGVVERERKKKTVIRIYYVRINLFEEKGGGEESEMVDNFKERTFSRCNRTNMHMKSQRLLEEERTQSLTPSQEATCEW